MRRHIQSGFSLVELSIVLLIVGILAGSAMVPLSSSIRQGHYRSTHKQLQLIREAMHGYLVSSGRLPCPIDQNSNPKTQGSKSSVCKLPFGAVPAAELGVMGERSEFGAVLDGWGRPIQYAVSMSDSDAAGTLGNPDWLSDGELGMVGAEHLTADITLCRKSVSGRCAKNDLIADQIVWVIYSLGERDDQSGLQIENQDNDNVFAVSAYSSHIDNPFDDQIVWASRSELVYWLLKANWLP